MINFVVCVKTPHAVRKRSLLTHHLIIWAHKVDWKQRLSNGCVVKCFWVSTHSTSRNKKQCTDTGCDAPSLSKFGEHDHLWKMENITPAPLPPVENGEHEPHPVENGDVPPPHWKLCNNIRQPTLQTAVSNHQRDSLMGRRTIKSCKYLTTFEVMLLFQPNHFEIRSNFGFGPNRVKLPVWGRCSSSWLCSSLADLSMDSEEAMIFLLQSDIDSIVVHNEVLTAVKNEAVPPGAVEVTLSFAASSSWGFCQLCLLKQNCFQCYVARLFVWVYFRQKGVTVLIFSAFRLCSLGCWRWLQHPDPLPVFDQSV